MRWAASLWLVAVVFSGCASGPVVTQGGGGGQYVGTTPFDAVSREFIGGLPANSACHAIAWNLTLLTNGSGGTYSLTATYVLPGRDDPNQLETGPQVTSNGRWEPDRARRGEAEATVYRLRSTDTMRSLALAQVGKHLLHFLAEDNSLKIGNAGWSYTLNRKLPVEN